MKRKRLMKWIIDNELKHSIIADKLAITRQHWSNIVNGKTNPSIALCERFKKAFNVENALELFEREG